LKYEVSEYENLSVEWVGGHTPTAYFKDEEGNTLEEVVLTNLDHEEMLNFFVLHGFAPKRPQSEFGEPLVSWDYQNHHYEYFKVKAIYKEAKDFAQERQYNDLNGYPVTLTSADEEASLVKHISDVTTEEGEVAIWLGLEDHAEEGVWAWSVGPEAETAIWEGKGTQGSIRDGQYNHWREHEPNNANDVSEEDCATVAVSQGTSVWNDVPCRWKNGLVVEYGDTSLDVANVEGVEEDHIHEDL